MKSYLYLIMTDQLDGFRVSVVKGVLWILSQVYCLLIALRRVLYKMGVCKSWQLSVPVISVGNITVGGSGKTPLVGFIASALKREKIQPAILIRGYMANKASVTEDSDEAVMLREAFDVPVLVGPNRVRNAEEFLKGNKPDVFLLDDGFQHWRLFRDLDIAVIDLTNPWGNGHLLPRGILREPKKALQRAHIFVLTKVDLGKEFLENVRNELSRINPDALIVESIHKPVIFSDVRSEAEYGLSDFKGQKVCTVCGIAAPNSFIKTLIELEVDIDEHIAFMDHHVYQKDDMERIVKLCQKKGITTVVTTEKDAVKLKPLMFAVPEYIRFLSLRIEISIVSGEGEFLERIRHIL